MSSDKTVESSTKGGENRSTALDRLTHLEAQISELQSLISAVQEVRKEASKTMWERRRVGDDDLARLYEDWCLDLEDVEEPLRVELNRLRKVRGQMTVAVNEALEGYEIDEN